MQDFHCWLASGVRWPVTWITSQPLFWYFSAWLWSVATLSYWNAWSEIGFGGSINDISWGKVQYEAAWIKRKWPKMMYSNQHAYISAMHLTGSGPSQPNFFKKVPIPVGYWAPLGRIKFQSDMLNGSNSVLFSNPILVSALCSKLDWPIWHI